MSKKTLKMMMKNTPTIRAMATGLRSYCRPLEEGISISLIENWEMACIRVVGHQRWLWERAVGRKLNEAEEAELQEIKELLVARKIAPAGRTMWLGGTEVSRKRESTQFNCAHSEAATLFDVVDMFHLLLQGCGVGFTPVVGSMHGFQRPLESIEVIRSKRTKKQWDAGERGPEKNVETYDEKTGLWTIVVGDSATAWAKAAGKLLVGKYQARKLVLDFSPLRIAGIRLKGYGWISSGDEKISEAFYAIAKILSDRADQLLSKIDILDIMNWLGTVLSSRRSAEIALVSFGDPEWRQFAVAKKDYFQHNQQRGQSNNSLVFNKEPTRKELEEIFRLMQDAGGSEPGFINGVEARRRAPWFSGMNPCVEIILANKGFCVAENTLMITKAGVATIKEYVGQEIEIWNGKRWSKVHPQQTGSNQKMLRVFFGDGSYLDTTEYHRFSVKDRFMSQYVEMEAKDLIGFANERGYSLHTETFYMGYHGGVEVKDAYTMAVVVGDGSVDFSPTHASGYAISIDLYGEKIELPVSGNKTTGKTKNGSSVPMVEVTGLQHLDPLILLDMKNHPRGFERVFSWSRKSILEFVAGLADTDGSETSTGGIRVCLSQYERAYRLQLLLTKCGIRSSVNLMEEKGTITNYGVRTEAQWYVQITDCAEIPCYRLDTSKGHLPKFKGKYQVIKDVVELPGLHDSYCFEEPEEHKAVFGNTLTHQCNLSEANLPAFRNDMNGLRRAVHLAGRMNYRQTCVDLRDGILQEGWHTNNSFLRLCGVGLTGVTARPDLKSYDYKFLKNIAVSAAHGMARELGMPIPKNVTCIKPSGTMSKVMGAVEWGEVPEGCHMPEGKYIFNEILYSKHDPLVAKLQAAGYILTPHPSDQESVLIRFPVKYDNVPFIKKTVVHADGTKEYMEVDGESAIKQLDRYKMLMENWSEQNVSITIKYEPKEIPKIISWLLRNWNSYVGVSFLYRNDPTRTAKDLGYPYLPQTVVSEKTFDAYVKTLKPVDFTGVEFADLVENPECAGGQCPLR